MARRADSRSPSPAGKRSQRGDDRYERDRRDDGKHYRRRSRSRSPDRRYRDRDSRRRDRSLDWRDRRDEDSYRPSRRDRSRERRRSRDRDVGRDRRYRSRERDYRDRRDDSRERARRRRDDSADSRRKARREDSKERAPSLTSSVKNRDSSRPPTPTKPTEEEKKAERLAKLEAWKKKQAAERDRKQKELEAAGGARSLLEEMDKKATAPPTTTATPISPTTPIDSAAPAPYAGKFDPKAIAKKANASSSGAAALGEDVALPQPPKPSTNLISAASSVKANETTNAAPGGAPKTGTSLSLKGRGNVGKFGFGTKLGPEGGKAAPKRTLDFGEEESTRKKLEKLPTPPPGGEEDNEDTVMANGVDAEDEDDEDIGMQDAGNEEEAAAAARAAAEKREERLQNQNRAYQSGDSSAAELAETNGEVTMTDAEAQPAAEEEEEEIDPLDAFMSELGEARKGPKPKTLSKGKLQEPEAMFGDDDVDLSAVDADPDDILAMAKQARKKKDIPTVNHDKVDYESFRKSFYSEPSELAELNEAEVADLRLELDGIKVRGVDVPKPVQKWSQFGLGVQSLDVIHRLGYDKPTSIQSQAVPAIMSGRDVIGVAKTGSGKTVAFLLPMFRHIKDQRPLESLEGPVALVMTPTRELATQIHRDCRPFLKALNLRAVCAYGGAPIKDQIADLKRGAEIIVCTPGRMIDLLAANSGRVTNLRRVTYVVLDEADRMFDMGFEPQVMKILANIRPDKQTVLFSATFPRQMEALARKTLAKPVEIIVGGRSVVAPEITQMVEVRAEDTKFIRLLELLGELYDADEDARTLIFVDRQESADSLLRDLMRKGYPCMSIHGGKDQIDRDSTISDFKAGVVPILVATSVAARGLDVKQLKLVVNYDAPNHLEDYVHRAGRTGRAGNTGTAVTFITPEQERYSVDIAKALKQSGQDVPAPVQNLVDSFIEKVKAGKEKASGSGFGGKGLERLDQERDAARNRERKTYKTGEEGEEEEKEETKEEEFVVKSAAAAQAPAAPAAAAPTTTGVPKGIDLDKITVHKTEAAPRAGSSNNPLDRVGQAVADIHSRLSKTGQMRTGVPIDNKGPDAGAFHATLEINDFPQKARWAVTNRTNVAKILEATGTSITTKGSFYGPGKEPQAGENPKLYILVEGDTELVVTNAMRELMRLLKEGTTAAMDSEARAPASGRYNVV
ncbi:P-loop containing nucleoside triphosphate hydrolase protein [Xylona heveae TC161]|uniref:RNA helicase n=1 Tax=Xylona heveae (strain CBS 132557 / TC161) TaxID=1328760 RepID=A0A165JLH7_XYLHT|nr:P-loop containing nucleoside triphosphate hydrolase protein [Xylona heveae TC161]KZF26388.1 P-loop containing nucleoside triphosphate hydrolase protein [Xylona heveae TC161]